MSKQVIDVIKKRLKENAPDMSDAQRQRMYKIINSDNPNFFAYRHKMADLEKIIKEILIEYRISYKEAVEVFKDLVKSNIHDENLAAYFYLNGFKKNFDDNTIEIFHDALFHYCDTWGLCDSSVIRIIGPYLGKNDALANKTIEKWSNSEEMWVRRASMVISLKIIMIKKDFEAKSVFDLAEKMLQYEDDYILKGVGWMLKTCSRYNPEVIIDYLYKNKDELPRLVLRYASEKLTKEERQKILKK